MAFSRPSRVRLIWWLELGVGLELYVCAVLALHARGLRVTPLLAAPALIIPALVIPPVFYLLVGLVIVRPLTLSRVLTAAAAMCGIHALLVVATGGLYAILDLIDFAAAVAFTLWGSPVVTLLQLTAAPLAFARLRPLILAPRSTPLAAARAAQTPRGAEAPGSVTPRTLGAPPVEGPSFPDPRGPLAPSTGQHPPIAPMSTAAPSVVPSVAPPPVTPAPLAAPPPVVSSPLPSLVKPSPPTGGLAALDPSASRPGIDDVEATVRVPFDRIADQLPVEMFVRGREGLNATLGPGVSLLVPRRLILPHLGDGLAPVEWKAIADQFPRNELALSHDEIARRLPRGALLLPLDEVVPQIPSQLLALSTPPVDVYGIEEFPPPFQPHVPPLEATADEPEALPAPAASEPVATVSPPREESAPRAEPEPSPEPEIELVAEAEARAEPRLLDDAEPMVDPEPIAEAEDVAAPESEVSVEPMALDESEREASDLEPAVTVERIRTAEAGRIAALLAPMMNGLEIAERVESGAPLVTVVAPPVSEDAVVRTTARLVPYMTDARLSEPATQATLTAADAAVVVTPIGSNGDGAILVAALASRASLAWLERLSRSAAGDGRGSGSHGKAGGRGGESSGPTGLRATSVPSSVSELADAMTAFGPVSPTVLRDSAGALRACLFLPRSLEALPLAEFAHDLYGALDGTELGEVSSVVLRVGAYCLVMRAVASASNGGTVLVGGGPTDRLGLARIELDRAATRLGTLVRG
jgi:hypothetical protein